MVHASARPAYAAQAWFKHDTWLKHELDLKETIRESSKNPQLLHDPPLEGRGVHGLPGYDLHAPNEILVSVTPEGAGIAEDVKLIFD